MTILLYFASILNRYATVRVHTLLKISNSVPFAIVFIQSKAIFGSRGSISTTDAVYAIIQTAYSYKTKHGFKVSKNLKISNTHFLYCAITLFGTELNTEDDDPDAGKYQMP